MAISINLTEAPANPQRSDPDNFRADADQYVDWHTQDFVPEMNQVIDDFNATIQNLWVGTSSTSNTVGTGSKTWTMIEDNLAFGIGNHVRVADSAAPTSNYMSGIITAYNKTTKVLTVNVLTKTGTATKNAWTITLEPPDEYNRVKTWSTMTGAASIPLVVEHDGVYYGLNTNLADVTAKEPGVDPEWTSFGNKTYQEFTASGTWTKPVGCKYVYVEIVNGGQSGNAYWNSSTTGSLTHSGGDGGYWMPLLLNAADVPATVPIIVGAGGAAVTRSSTQGYGRTNGIMGGKSTFNGLGPSSGAEGYTFGQSTYATPARTTINGGGGAGGGQNWPAGTGAIGAIGNSVMHGDSGQGYSADGANATGEAGAFPGGGGGCAVVRNGSTYTATSGAGGNGTVRVWTW